MKIYLGRNYTNDAFLNLKDCGGIAFDTEIVNVEGLVSMLELYVGIPYKKMSKVDRQAEWLKCMRKVMVQGENVFTKSWEMNRLGVSNECLAWRDSLKMAGWNRDMKQPSKRFQIIAEVDREFDAPSTGDRILTLLDALKDNPFSEPTEIRVGEPSPEALEPIVVRLLDRLAQLGVEVTYTPDKVLAPKGSNLAKVQELFVSGGCDKSFSKNDDSFQIWNFPSATNACRYMALLPKEEFDMYVVGNGKLLDNTQRMLGQSTSGTTLDNVSPQIVQMFMLGMNLFEYPLNIRNLLDWLQLPIHPLESKLRYSLIDVIVDSGGFDNSKYHEAIDKYLGKIEDPKERERRKRDIEIFDIRPSKDVDMNQLRVFTNSLRSWAAQMSQFDKLELEKRDQLSTVAQLCTTFDQIIHDIDDEAIPYTRLEAAISTLYSGSECHMYLIEAGSRHTVYPYDIVEPADRTAWIDCYNYKAKNYPYEFLNDCPVLKNLY